jgi:hypothetical protein
MRDVFALILRPLLFSYAVCIAWLIIYRGDCGIAFLPGDEKSIASFVSIFTTGWAFLAGFSLAKVYSHRSDTKRAVAANDWNQFVLCMSRRLSPMTYVVLTILSVFLLGELFSLQFRNTIFALYSIGGASFVLALMPEMIRDIDDPLEGAWNIDNIPEEWILRLRKQNAKTKPA